MYTLVWSMTTVGTIALLLVLFGGFVYIILYKIWLEIKFYRINRKKEIEIALISKILTKELNKQLNNGTIDKQRWLFIKDDIDRKKLYNATSSLKSSMPYGEKIGLPENLEFYRSLSGE